MSTGNAYARKFLQRALPSLYENLMSFAKLLPKELNDAKKYDHADPPEKSRLNDDLNGNVTCQGSITFCVLYKEELNTLSSVLLKRPGPNDLTISIPVLSLPSNVKSFISLTIYLKKGEPSLVAKKELVIAGFGLNRKRLD